MVTLVRASARKATARYGIVVPRGTAWMRASVGLVNWSLRLVLRRRFGVHGSKNMSAPLYMRSELRKIVDSEALLD
jgi:hypothetical protein